MGNERVKMGINHTKFVQEENISGTSYFVRFKFSFQFILCPFYFNSMRIDFFL